MINISSSLKNACKSDKLVYREYIIIAGTSTKIDVKAKLYQTAYKDNHFIGTFNLSYIKFSADNSVDYKKKEFTYFKEINGTPIQIGKYIVTDVKDNDTTEEIEVTAYDYGLKFDVPYVTELNYSSNEITLYDVLQECCTKCGVTLGNEEITNGDFIVDSNQFEENEITGNVISAIAFMSGDFAYITNEGKLKLKFTEQTNEIIEDYVDLDDKRDTQPITSVSLGMTDVEGEAVIRKDQTLIDQYGEHWLIINDDPFAYTPEKREALIDGIFNKVKGFGYSSFTAKDTFMPYMELGDLIQFRNKEGNLVNSIILREETDYDKITFSAPSVTKATLEYEPPMDAETLSKQTRLIVDKENQRITSVITQIGDRTGKTSTLTQDIDGLDYTVGVVDMSKGTLSQQTAQLRVDVAEIRGEIGDITDVTITKDGVGTVYFNEGDESINESQPINMLIYPTTEDISCVYPSNGTYPTTQNYPAQGGLVPSGSLTPSNSLVPATGFPAQYIKYPTTLYIDFYNETEDEHIYYPFPKDLRILGTTYDEFQYDYENTTCKVIRRIGINSYGEKYILQNPAEEEIEFPEIHLTTGKYVVTFIPFNTAYMKIRLMSQNMYTSQFATKVEMNGKFELTSEHFTTELSKKVGNEEVISRINQTAEAITIEANKIDLNGVATFTNGKLKDAGSTIINGANITTGTIDATKVNVTNLDADNIVTGTIDADLIAAGAITGDKIAAGTITGNKLDINGVITSINNNTSTTINGNKITTGSVTASQIAAGTITATQVASDIITTTNFSAQNIDASKITTGTLSAASISLKNVSFTPTTSSIAGWNINNTYLSGSGAYDVSIYKDGRASFGNNYGWINTGSAGTWVQGNSYNHPCYLLDTYSHPSKETDKNNRVSIRLHTEYGKIYLSADTNYGGANASGGDSLTHSDIELAANNGSTRIYNKINNWIRAGYYNIIEGGSSGGVLVSCSSGVISIGMASNTFSFSAASRINIGANSTSVYINGSPYGGSSKNMKKDIKLLSNEELDKIYEAYKEQNIYSFKYKKGYDDDINKKRYGFILDEMENTILQNTLDIQDIDDKGTKRYNPEYLSRTNFIVIKMLQNKIDLLQKEIEELKK